MTNKVQSDSKDAPLTECPYPGLRSFQGHEANYFFGRDEQIKEIVAQLVNNRLVAVIGGSGSGKSSLILAGAIPELRTAVIKEAGDFWVPIITTPGTNYAKNDSPIHQLAKVFCTVLVELPDKEEAQQRLNDCVKLLRTSNGLGALIKKYGRDLKDNGGVDLEPNKKSKYLVKTNFLILIDQFEELFHPSNEMVRTDCQHLVQRIIDHYKQNQLPLIQNKSSHICVAITMRSEHLNDCPRYEDLPDVINATSYLVKRLNQVEIKEAIIRPAQAFLRNEFRKTARTAHIRGLSSPDENKWPNEIIFDKQVINRLLRDSREIVALQDHADLLPLLQHLLYWIWVCSVERKSSIHSPYLPGRIKLEDLVTAVGKEPCSNKKFSDDTNALLSCLENRCEWIFEEEKNLQSDWKRIFDNLAFKDPNTGTYTQQRLSFDEFNELLNISKSHEKYSKDEGEKDPAIILNPWLKNHKYLVFDYNNKTIKVAHESLIRRWKRFRDWIDWRDRQFQIYVQLHYDCVKWTENGCKESDLVQGVALRRIEEFKLVRVLESQSLLNQFYDYLDILQYKQFLSENLEKKFSKLLNIHRDKKQLNQGLEHTHDFLNQSFKKRRKTKLTDLGLKFILPLSLIFIVFLLNNNVFLKEEKDTLKSDIKHLKNNMDLMAYENTILLSTRISLSKQNIQLGKKRTALEETNSFLQEENDLSEVRETLLLSIEIADESKLAIPQIDSLEYDYEAQIALRNFLAAVNMGEHGRNRFNKLRSTKNRKAQEKIRKLSNLSEYRTLSGLRSILLTKVWSRHIPWKFEPDELIEQTENIKDGTKAIEYIEEECKNDFINKVIFYTSKARNDEEGSSYGLLAYSVENGIQIYWSKRNKDGECSFSPKQMISWVGHGTELGIDAHQNYIIEFNKGSTNITVIDWPANGQPQEDSRLATRRKLSITEHTESSVEKIRQSENTIINNNSEEKIHIIKIPTFKEKGGFFDNIKIDTTWYAILNHTPKKIDTKTEKFEDISNMFIPSEKECKENVGLYKNKINFKTQEWWKLRINDKRVYCLLITSNSSSPTSETMYYGDIYRISLEEHRRKVFLPILDSLEFSNISPKKIRMNEKEGIIYISANKDKGPWFKVPWGQQAWTELASDVFFNPPISDEKSKKSKYWQYIGHLVERECDLNNKAVNILPKTFEKLKNKKSDCNKAITK